jgi:hypothetical protein
LSLIEFEGVRGRGGGGGGGGAAEEVESHEEKLEEDDVEGRSRVRIESD